MGFGTLFFGYCLLLNVTYYAASDVFAGLIMLMGLLKLAAYSKYFGRARWLAGGFAVLGFAEFALFFGALFFPALSAFYDGIGAYIAVVRYAVLAVMTLLILLGMEEVAREVELAGMPHRCRVLAYLSVGVYAVWILLDLPLPLIPISVRAVVYFVAILAMLALLITNLFTIYGCYMRICLPGEETGKRRKPSRFAFVNEYRERQQEREREEEEYRREQMKKRAERKKK